MVGWSPGTFMTLAQQSGRPTTTARITEAARRKTRRTTPHPRQVACSLIVLSRNFHFQILCTVAPPPGSLSNGMFELGFESKGLSTAPQRPFLARIGVKH